MVVYAVDEVLAKIREDGMDETAARDLPEMWVKGAMFTATSSLVPPSAATQSVDPQRVLWLNGRMVVQTVEAGHRQIRDTLEVIRKLGAAEIALEVRFVCLDEKEVKEILPGGTTLAVEAPDRVVADAVSVQPAVFDRPLASYAGTRVSPVPRQARRRIAIKCHALCFLDAINRLHKNSTWIGPPRPQSEQGGHGGAEEGPALALGGKKFGGTCLAFDISARVS